MQALQIEDNTATSPLLSAPRPQRKDGKGKLTTVAMVIAILAFAGVIAMTATRQAPAQVGRQQAVMGVASDSESGVIPVPLIVPHVHGDYYLTPNVGNYADVKQQCAVSGGEMASIHNDAENGEVSALCGAGVLCWIGFTDKTTEDTWVWEDGSDNSYTKWNPPHEPNNAGNEDCAVINWGAAGSQNWNDLPCAAAAHHYKGVCQKIPTLDSYQCPPGTFDKQKHVAGQPCICEECSAGKFCVGYVDGENQDPEPCAKGTYQPLKGQSQCDASPPGHKVPDEGSTGPTECPAGKYQDEYGQDSCKQCPKGNKCPGTANVNPTQCNEGKHQDEEGEAGCKPCPLGNKCPNKGMIDPTPCHFGKYQDEQGKVGCKECLIGHKCPNTGMDAPTECPVDQFQPCTQQIDCVPCEQSLTTTTTTNGLTAQAMCAMGSCTEMIDTVFDGAADIPGGFRNGMTLAQCQQYCQSLSNCKCYTSFNSGCWVKQSCDTVAPNRDHTSGVCRQ